MQTPTAWFEISSTVVCPVHDYTSVCQCRCPASGCCYPIATQCSANTGSSGTVQAVTARQTLEITSPVQGCATAYDCTSVCLCRCPASGCSCCTAIQCNAETGDSSTVQAVTAGRAVDVQCSCGHAFCFACLAPAHEPAACRQVRHLAEHNSTQLSFSLSTHASLGCGLATFLWHSFCYACLAHAQELAACRQVQQRNH